MSATLRFPRHEFAGKFRHKSSQCLDNNEVTGDRHFSGEADKINELEKLISEKVSQSKEHENRHQKINEPHLSNGCSNSLGLDETVFQEEMDWIREVRSQNNMSTFEKPEKVSSPVLKEIEKESKRR